MPAPLVAHAVASALGAVRRDQDEEEQREREQVQEQQAKLQRKILLHEYTLTEWDPELHRLPALELEVSALRQTHLDELHQQTVHHTKENATIASQVGGQASRQAGRLSRIIAV